MRTLLLLLSALLLSSGGALAAGLTQRDLMTNLVDGLGWSFGLPDEPGDADYQAILLGARSLRIEAEAAKQPTDVVSVKTYRTFGDYSGDGWVSGIATPTTAHLRFLLPWDGRYRLTASLRLPGHEIAVGDQTFRADGENSFTEVVLGEADLAAGKQEATVHIPANGAIDYLELSAPPLPAVQPLAGWEPDRPLSRDDLAVAAVRLLGLEEFLPPSGVAAVTEAEDAGETTGMGVTDIRHLGTPSAGRWLRAGGAPARVLLSFTPPADGVYTLLLHGAAGGPVTATLNGRLPLSGTFPSYLQTVPLGTAYLAAQENTLDLHLPARGGVDTLTLAGRRSAGADYRRLAGLAGGESPPSPEELDALLALLAAVAPPR